MNSLKSLNSTPLEVDYLVIGTGATAMAFVDTLLDEQPEATVLMVDRLHHPGKIYSNPRF